ncbi:MAG: HAD family phosphatase [Muribaculaceae bacterium]|nr:HAD family phosphatase [Muribaculaceae bacterium]MDE6285659.1 HAD family phosphatase [Muribaculaceae bacterium]
MTHCKNLLFDLGGVIMDIDRERCVRSFRRLGFENAADYLGDYGQQGPFGDIEAGRISAAEFHKIISGLIPGGADDGRIDRAFNAFLVGIPVERLRALRELRARYGIYLLSNTNEIMWHDRIARAFRAEGMDVNAYFDGIVTSFDAKALKPSPEIFRYAAEHLGIRPEETVFLDDSEANVEAARALGFGGLHVAPGREFTDILKENGL